MDNLLNQFQDLLKSTSKENNLLRGQALSFAEKEIGNIKDEKQKKAFSEVLIDVKGGSTNVDDVLKKLKPFINAD